MDMMKNTQDLRKATAKTKTSLKTLRPCQKHQAALPGRRMKSSITQTNIRGKAFQFGYERPSSKGKKV